MVPIFYYNSCSRLVRRRYGILTVPTFHLEASNKHLPPQIAATSSICFDRSGKLISHIRVNRNVQFLFNSLFDDHDSRQLLAEIDRTLGSECCIGLNSLALVHIFFVSHSSLLLLFRKMVNVFMMLVTFLLPGCRDPIRGCDLTIFHTFANSDLIMENNDLIHLRNTSRKHCRGRFE